MRFVTSHRATPQLPRDMRARLACEVLEDRRLLSVAPLEVPPPVPLSPDAASVGGEIATPLTSLDDQIGLYRHGLLVQSFPPAADTDEDRGAALRTAASRRARLRRDHPRPIHVRDG